MKKVTRGSSISNSLIYNYAVVFARNNMTFGNLERARFWFKFHASAKNSRPMRRLKPNILL